MDLTGTKETVVISPYAVIGEVGVARTLVNRAKGLRMRILTNSLASTDEPVAHTGYRRHRKAMLRAGLELYELDPVASERLELPAMRGRPVLRIHTKAAVVDRRLVYLGSMNFDPRSVALNTEVGVVIESDAFARDVLTLLEPLMEQGSWRVRLGDDGEPEWLDPDGGAPLRLEPRTTVWERLRQSVLSWLVPESVL